MGLLAGRSPSKPHCQPPPTSASEDKPHAKGHQTASQHVFDLENTLRICRPQAARSRPLCSQHRATHAVLCGALPAKWPHIRPKLTQIDRNRVKNSVNAAEAPRGGAGVVFCGAHTPGVPNRTRCRTQTWREHGVQSSKRLFSQKRASTRLEAAKWSQFQPF